MEEVRLENIKLVYFLGIGGIGMSALARWFHENGFVTAGYDKTETELTKQLAKEGIAINYTDTIEELEKNISQYSVNDVLIVYTPAIPKDNIQFNSLKDNNYLLQKRSQVLGLLTAKYFTIAVAGTHGKTTTSSLVAHILRYAKVNSMAFLGGITQNYQTNLLLNDKDAETAPIVVVEADEYDRSFLTLSPNVAIITATDPDHLDIYDDESTFHKGFEMFVDKIEDGGALIYHEGIEKKIVDNRATGIQKIEYSLNDTTCKGKNITVKEGKQWFDYVYDNAEIKEIAMRVPGEHNISNTVAGITSCLLAGVDKNVIKEAVEDFRGVRRRFEYMVEQGKKIYIDDYAHHPSEITSFLNSVRNLYPSKKITAIFQPHLFSRTRDFMEGFAESLALADELLLLDIYPARELPIEGITSQVLFDKISMENKKMVIKENVLDLLHSTENEIVVTIGAGDIDLLREPIKELFI